MQSCQHQGAFDWKSSAGHRVERAGISTLILIRDRPGVIIVSDRVSNSTRITPE
jgi:hypothetical protein